MQAIAEAFTMAPAIVTRALLAALAQGLTSSKTRHPSKSFPPTQSTTCCSRVLEPFPCPISVEYVLQQHNNTQPAPDRTSMQYFNLVSLDTVCTPAS